MSRRRASIGEMRTLLTLQTLADSVDASGGIVKTPSTAGTFWGKLSSLRGTENQLADQVSGEVTHVFQTRRDSALAITNNHRFLSEDASRTFHVVHVDNVDDENDRLDVLLKEEV